MTYREPLCAIVGAMFGGATAWYFTKRKYEAIEKQNVDEARAHYNKRLAELSATNRNKPDISDLVADISVKKEDEKPPFGEYSAAFQTEPDEDDIPEDVVIRDVGPRLVRIDEDDWAEPSRYEKVSVMVYADGVVARDDNDEPLDVEKTIGTDAYREISNRTAAEAIYVRNETAVAEYEILNSEMTYTEATGIYLEENT